MAREARVNPAHEPFPLVVAGVGFEPTEVWPTFITRAFLPFGMAADVLILHSCHVKTAFCPPRGDPNPMRLLSGFTSDGGKHWFSGASLRDITRSGDTHARQKEHPHWPGGRCRGT